jgi:O-antigen/teichoic acid export membrane protein
MEWFFYTFLWRRFKKRNIVGINLREQPWQSPVKAEMPKDEFAVDKKYLTQSSLFSVLGTIFKVAGPVLMILVARIFDKEEFGIYVSVQLLMLMFSRVAVLGLDKGLHWFIPQNRLLGRPAYYGVSESVHRSLVMAFGILCIGVVASFFGLHKYSASLSGLSLVDNALFFGSLLPWVVIHVLSGASEGNRKPQYKIFVNDFAVATLAPLIALGLHFCGMEHHELPLGLLSANCIGALILVWLAVKQFPNMPWISKNRLDPTLFRYALPLGFSEVVVSLLLRMDLWMVLLFLGPGYAGVYALMVTISNGLRTISLSYAPILLPVVAGMKPERYSKDLKGTYSYCVALVTLIQLAIGFFIVLFPDEILMIAGKSFVINPEVLGILLFGNLLNGFFGLSGTVINGMGNSRFMLKLNIFTLIFALSLNALLIPRMGLAGAALSTASYQLMQCVWMNVYLVRMGYWPYKKSLLVQVGWIVALLALYIGINSGMLRFAFYQDVLVFVVALAGLFVTLWSQGLMDSLFAKGKK